jgi:hypothetical protein
MAESSPAPTCAVPVQAPHAAHSGDEAPHKDDIAAPSPTTVVTANWRRTIEAEEQARAREAALSVEHAAEIARLTQALRDARRAHAADIAQHRIQHAMQVRQLVEALRRSQNPAKTPASERPAALWPPLLGLLARVVRKGRAQF